MARKAFGGKSTLTLTAGAQDFAAAFQNRDECRWVV